MTRKHAFKCKSYVNDNVHVIHVIIIYSVDIEHGPFQDTNALTKFPFAAEIKIE
jgi:hypothetical protein